MACIAGWLLYIGRRRTKRSWRKHLLTLLATVVLVGGWSSVWITHKHAYEHNGPLYLDDADQDGTPNYTDPDMDGDGITNLQDNDANGNGIPNTEDIYLALESMRGVWFDPLNGSLLNMFTRLGFFLHSDVPFKAYDAAGIFLIEEIRNEAANNPDFRPTGDVSDAVDVRYAQNLYELALERQWMLPSPEVFGALGICDVYVSAQIEQEHNIGQEPNATSPNAAPTETESDAEKESESLAATSIYADASQRPNPPDNRVSPTPTSSSVNGPHMDGESPCIQLDLNDIEPVEIRTGDLVFLDEGMHVGVISSCDPSPSETETNAPLVPNITMIVPTEEVFEYSVSDLEATIGRITDVARPL